MNEDERFNQIMDLVGMWQGTSACRGLSRNQLIQLAAVAIDRSHSPREWGSGETIPLDVVAVESVGGLRWVRDPDRPAGVWTTDSAISDDELVATLGPVREADTEDWEPGDWWGLAGAAVLDEGHQEQVPADVPARLAATVIPVLKEAREATHQVDQAYRTGRRLSVALSRRAKNAAARCDAAIEALSELTGEVTS